MIDFAALDPETRRHLAAAGVALAWVAFCGLIAARHALRRRAERREAAALAQGAGEPVLVAYASQTGFAEELARATATALTAGGAGRGGRRSGRRRRPRPGRRRRRRGGAGSPDPGR